MANEIFSRRLKELREKQQLSFITTPLASRCIFQQRECRRMEGAW